jgi:hypothetical protein
MGALPYEINERAEIIHGVERLNSDQLRHYNIGVVVKDA